ncbi:MAG TPA: 16S rRNA (adenine(1518)-N(6)/adenine(1519)-N(6))-dimethyltransferase RsmA [Bacteroidetes bacterium]|nr:16S rRNA (adenine(1518)-N(6)/adenine(1519)-N(6))-dimethyltransferase RsmA [Bacteroidota bacterium]
MYIKPKKHLGQHFLADLNIAHKIVDAFHTELGDLTALEIGPGKGVLSNLLLEKSIPLSVAEVDRECVAFLKEEFPQLKIYHQDFLKMDIHSLFEKEIAVIGNFPYNISSQILFKVIHNREQVPLMLGMFQKEVAERISATHGNKTYGILSVLTQAYYDVEYLFTVSENVFVPPPKVKSAVIKIKRKKSNTLANTIPQAFFIDMVKTAFNQRRKTLRNALRKYYIEETKNFYFWDKRAEQISVEEMLEMAKVLEPFCNNQTH